MSQVRAEDEAWPSSGGEPRRRARGGSPSLPPRAARRRAGDRCRARARQGDDLPLARVPGEAAGGGDHPRHGACARRGALRLEWQGRPRRSSDTFDRFNRALADAPALRAFVEQERDASLRIIASGAGIVQPRIVELITGDDRRGGRGRGPMSRPLSRPYSASRSSSSPRPSSSTTPWSGSAATSTACASSRRRCSECRRSGRPCYFLTLHLSLAGVASTVPSASLARTWNECLPRSTT